MGVYVTKTQTDSCLYVSLRLAGFSLPLILMERTALLRCYITVIIGSFSLPPAQGEQALSPTGAGAGAHAAFSQTLWGSWPCSVCVVCIPVEWQLW